MIKINKKLSIVVLIILLITTSFCQNQQVSRENEKKVVAIFPFHFAATDQAKKEMISQLNMLFYDLFAGQFTATDYFEVVDRQHIQEMLDEMNLQVSGVTQDQVIEMGQAKGAELAIFGSVTNIYKNTFLTLKIIDIETTVILKSIKARGTLEDPDVLAQEAGYKFMKGLSNLLYNRYRIGTGEIDDSSKKGIKFYLRGRDLIQQAIIAKNDDDRRKMKKLKKKGEKFLKKAASVNDQMQTIVADYQEENFWKLEN